MKCIDELPDLPALPWKGAGYGTENGPSNEALISFIRAGDELHPSIVRLADRGWTQEQLTALLNESAARTERPERWRECVERDIPRAVESAAKRRLKEAAKTFGSAPPVMPPQSVALETFSAAAFQDQPIPEQRWLCRGLIPAGQPCLLSGDGGLGKSLLALQLAASVVTGRIWLSRVVETGAALYVSCEDEAAEIHRRLDKIVLDLRVTLSDLGNLHIAPMAEVDALLAVSGGGGGLKMTPLYDALARRVEELRPTVVILDSLADVFGGNEINRGEVRWFIGQLRKLCLLTGATIVILSHPSLSGMATGSGLSGSTHWNNSVRSRLYMTKPEGEGADTDERLLTVMKNNRGEMGQKVELRWERGVFVAIDGGDAKRLVDGDVDAMFLRFLARYAEQGRYVNASGGTTYAPAAFEKEPEAKARRFKKRQFSDAMARLFDAGRIAVATRKAGGHERQFIEIVGD